MGNLRNLLTNPMELGDQVNALTTAVLLDEDASDSNLASNLAGGALGSVPAQSAPDTTGFVASPTTSGHTFLLGWQPSGAAVAPHAIDATSLTLAAASSATPIADGVGAAGVASTFSRGDHVHPVAPYLAPGTLYSAAGTPLPAVTGLAGARAFVSDATANVYGTAYVSGGAITAPVWCDGTAWNMG